MRLTHRLLGSTVLAGLALVTAALPAEAEPSDLILDGTPPENLVVDISQSYGSVTVGENTSGHSLTVNAGVTIETSHEVFISKNSAAENNTVTIYGALIGDGDVAFYVGRHGDTAELNVRDGGQVSGMVDLIVGDSESSSGNRTEVSGASSQISAWAVTVGTSGSTGNVLDVTGGGSVETDYFVAGYFSSSANSVVVSGQAGPDGPSSRLDVSGWLVVGHDGGSDNTITVEQGGELAASIAAIGAVRSENNMVTITGTGSSWEIGWPSPSSSNQPFFGQSGEQTVLLIGSSSEAWLGSTMEPQSPLPSDVDPGALNNRVRVLNGAEVRVYGGTVIGATEQDTGNALEISGAGSSFNAFGNVSVNGGNSITVGSGGTLSVGGSLTVDDGAMLRVFVADPQPDQASAGAAVCALSNCQPPNQGASTITIDGQAFLDGSLEAVIGTEDLQQNRYTLLVASGGIEGQFDEMSLAPWFQTAAIGQNADFQFGYTDTEVYLSIQSEIGGGGLNTNQSGVSGALNTYFNNGGQLPPGFTPLFGLTGAELEQALSALSGEVGATGGAQSVVEVNSLLLGQMLNGFMGGRPGPGTAGGTQVAGLNILPTADAPPPEGAGWTMWGSVMGGTAELPGESGDGSHNTGTSIMGLATGWDHSLSDDTVAGIAIGAGGTRWDVDAGLGSGESLFLQLGAHGTHYAGNAYVGLAGAYGWHALSTERRVDFGGGAETLEADVNASSLSGRVEAGYRLGSGDVLGLTPYAALQAQAVFIPDYEEEPTAGAGDYALDYDASTSSAVRGELGLRLDTALGASGGRAFAGAAWAHDWTDGGAVDASFQSLPGSSFTVHGAEAPGNIALVHLGAELPITAAALLAASFDGEFGEDYQSYAGNLSIRWNW